MLSVVDMHTVDVKMVNIILSGIVRLKCLFSINNKKIDNKNFKYYCCGTLTFLFYNLQAAIVVDAKHPEVAAIVDAAMAIAEKQEVTVAPEVWIDAMEQAINDAEKKTREAGENAPL